MLSCVLWGLGGPGSHYKPYSKLNLVNFLEFLVFYWVFSYFITFSRGFSSLRECSERPKSGKESPKGSKKTPDQIYKPYSKLFFRGPWVFSYFLVFSRNFTCFHVFFQGLGRPGSHYKPYSKRNLSDFLEFLVFYWVFSYFITFSRGFSSLRKCSERPKSPKGTQKDPRPGLQTL